MNGPSLLGWRREYHPVMPMRHVNKRTEVNSFRLDALLSAYSFISCLFLHHYALAITASSIGDVGLLDGNLPDFARRAH